MYKKDNVLFGERRNISLWDAKLFQKTGRCFCQFSENNITSGQFSALSGLNQLTSFNLWHSLANQEKKVRIRCKQRITGRLKPTREVMFTSPATSTQFPPLIGNVYHIRERSRRGSSLRGTSRLLPCSLANDTFQSLTTDIENCCVRFSGISQLWRKSMFVINWGWGDVEEGLMCK